MLSLNGANTDPCVTLGCLRHSSKNPTEEVFFLAESLTRRMIPLYYLHSNNEARAADCIGNISKTERKPSCQYG